MPGQLDEISRSIGSLEAGVSNLRYELANVMKRMDARETLQDRRHKENQEAIETASRVNRDAVEASRKAVQDIMDVVQPLNGAVKTMAPIVAAYQVSRWKKAGALSFALVLLSFLGWLAEVAIGKFIGYLMSHFH